MTDERLCDENQTMAIKKKVINSFIHKKQKKRHKSFQLCSNCSNPSSNTLLLLCQINAVFSLHLLPH